MAKLKHKDWFDESNDVIQVLLAQKRALHQACLPNPTCPVKKAAFRQACSTLQRELRELQNRWWINLAETTKLCADTGDCKRFYERLKTVYGPTCQIQSPLRSFDGQTLLTNKESILNRWTEHFETLFSINRTVSETALNRIPQQPVATDLDNPPTYEETIKAIKQLKNGKAAGVMVSQHSSGSAVAKLYTANYMNFLRVAGSKVNFLKTCEMLLSLPCTKTKEKSQIAQITEGSPYCPSLEKSLQEFS